MRVAIAGASGFVGQALGERLNESGHDVVALSRSVSDCAFGTAVAVDVGDESATAEALTDVDVAYYLVHSMAAGVGFPELDLRLATAFGRAAMLAGVTRIVYLGALGSAPDSAHLASRQEVGTALAAAGVAVVELRAAVVFGSGSISFEMLRCLTERLPAMVCPRWVRTRIQPIGLVDLLDYLEESLSVAPGVYEIGGADTTTYRDMISEYARVRGLRPRRIIDIPWLTPHLSSYWVDLVTPVDRAVSHTLIESLTTEVVVLDADATRRAFSIEPMGVAQALAAALDDQEGAVTRSLLSRDGGVVDGVYTVVIDVDIPPGHGETVDQDLEAIGGEIGWYGATWGWVIRLAVGRLVGEHLGTQRPEHLVAGAAVDWWRVARSAPGELVLQGVGWFPGDAWLGYHVRGDVLHQVAAFRPRGIPGFLYWKLLGPVHHVVFRRMARHRVRGVAGRR